MKLLSTSSFHDLSRVRHQARRLSPEVLEHSLLFGGFVFIVFNYLHTIFLLMCRECVNIPAMLVIFRRHLNDCRKGRAREDRASTGCNCPIHAAGSLGGQRLRVSVNTRSWERAQKLVRDAETRGSWNVPLPEPPPGSVAVFDACKRFIEDAQARNLRPSSISNLAGFTANLIDFCNRYGKHHITDLTIDDLAAWRGEWTLRPGTAAKYIGYLRHLFRFAISREWLARNPALALKPPKNNAAPTMPLTAAEIEQLHQALPGYLQKQHAHAHGNAAVSDHIPRLGVLLRIVEHSGLRWGDATGLSVEQLDGDRLRLRTAKSGQTVSVPLPPEVLTQLQGLSLLRGRYFFWRGGHLDSATGDYRRSFQALAEFAGIKERVHPHRLRDTFACRLLLAGVPLERVSKLLGHSSIKTTERAYAPWIREMQEQLEADVRATWTRKT
jgi:integrase